MVAQLEIIYEDDNLVVLNKPAGVNFDWALAIRPVLISIHRLDKDTSGVIVFAKNQKTADYLKSLFQSRQIKKTYTALVVGVIKTRSGIIDLPIGRSKKTPLKRVAVGEQRGKIREAITAFKVLKRFSKPISLISGFKSVKKSDLSIIGEFTLVEVYPKTGRTHQIRSHFSAIGHPIVCDKLYSGRSFICPSGLTRQFLHASAIEFTLQSDLLASHQKTKTSQSRRIRLEVGLPKDLDSAIFSLCHH